jgi:hypothetical protein
MFYPADDRYRAQYRVSCRNALHTVFKVPYACPILRSEEATEVASQEQVYHKRAFDPRENRKPRRPDPKCRVPSG